jgi:hypothetical protein
MAGEIKILSEEQFDILTNDIAKFIGQIQKLKEDFDAPKMRAEIIAELKKFLSTKNSLFKSLENESLELESNLIALKNVKKEFYDCKNQSEIRLIIGTVSGMLVGGIITILMMWFMGKFG